MADRSDAVTHVTGTVLVAVAATFSLFSIVFVALYLSYLLVRQSGKQKAKGHFLRSQFGFLFANLLLADLLQAMGFAFTFHWVATNRKPSSADLSGCRTQAVFIQTGDVSSALWTLTIALHTCAFIRYRYRPPTWLIALGALFIWSLTLSLTFAGPAYNAPGSVGLWCWIKEYFAWKLYGHYIFIFCTAFGSVTTYIAIFVYLYFRVFQKGLHNIDSVSVSSGRRTVRKRSKVMDLPLRILRRVAKRRADDAGSKDVDRVALTMLLFPLTYIFSTLPLTVYRLGTMTGRDWGSNASLQAACGILFSLGGAWNALLYVVSRKMWIHNGDSSSGPSQKAGITSKIQVTFQTHRQVDGDDGEHDLELSKLPVVSEDEKDSAVIAADEVRLPSAAFRGSERSPAIYITDDRHTRLDSHYEAKV